MLFSSLVILNYLGLFLSLKFLYNYEEVFKNSDKSLVKGNVDLVETVYFVSVFSLIGNLTFVTGYTGSLYQIIGGLASCFLHVFLNWVMRVKYGKLCKSFFRKA